MKVQVLEDMQATIMQSLKGARGYISAVRRV